MDFPAAGNICKSPLSRWGPRVPRLHQQELFSLQLTGKAAKWDLLEECCKKTRISGVLCSKIGHMGTLRIRKQFASRLEGDVWHLLGSRTSWNCYMGGCISTWKNYGFLVGNHIWVEMASAVLPRAPLQEMGTGLEGPSIWNSTSIFELYPSAASVSAHC